MKLLIECPSHDAFIHDVLKHSHTRLTPASRKFAKKLLSYGSGYRLVRLGGLVDGSGL